MGLGVEFWRPERRRRGPERDKEEERRVHVPEKVGPDPPQDHESALPAWVKSALPTCPY